MLPITVEPVGDRPYRLIIAKHFEFEAAHQLPNDPCYGKCATMHGHTYKLIIEVEGPLNEEKGWLVNFSEVKSVVKERIIDKLDHTFLNESTGLKITTAENLLLWIADKINNPIRDLGLAVSSITLYETSNSYAKIIF